MRADRLVSLVLLLRQRGRMTATQLASELEVSPRTVLRDIDAPSTAGVPVYADRGRRGGFSLLPGFRTELTGLNHDEALALLTAASGQGQKAFGLSAPLASAMRKVVDALPDGHRTSLGDAAKRFLVEPEHDLLSRKAATEEIADDVMAEARRAVLAGHKLRFCYTALHKNARWHTVDRSAWSPSVIGCTSSPHAREKTGHTDCHACSRLKSFRSPRTGRLTSS